MPLNRYLACIACLTLLLLASPAQAAPEGGAGAPAQPGFYDRIMAILQEPPKLEPPVQPPAPPIAAVRPNGTPIFGAPEISKEQMINFIRRHNPLPKLTVAVEELVELYWDEAGIEGIRPDLALAQAILETGYFRYGGDVLPAQNNFCGLGTTGGGARGAWFDSARIGVRAHIQHLLAYSTAREPAKPIVDPRYDLVKSLPQYFAQCASWESLGGKWAIPGVGYGEKIVKILDYIKGGGG